MKPTRVPSRLNVNAAYGFWLAGLTDGEGTFKLHQTRPGGQREIGFKIALRDDDTSTLIAVKERLGCGNVTYSKSRKPKVNEKPMAIFKACKIADLAEIIVPLFDAYPLHTKKAREFEIWKTIVLMKYRDTAGGPVNEDISRYTVSRSVRRRNN
jgi:hypothetical protein